MQREALVPRAGWQREMESIGFHFHSIDGTYWDESRCYRFTAAQIDTLEAATAELHDMALNAAQQVVGSGRMDEFAIPREWQALVATSWQAHLDGDARAFSLLGRMDLAYDGVQPPKLLEYNADTPTALLEASVAQWHWLQARTRAASHMSEADQFNSIHEKLLEGWRVLRERSSGRTLHFAAVYDSLEDWGNTEYLRDTAAQAGWDTRALAVEDIGHDGARFVGVENEPIERLFKLYPWEWLLRDEFAPHLVPHGARQPPQLIEPAWKMLLANKALLVILWELYPDHPNLLPAYADPAPLGERFVRKPKLAREGANVTLVDGGTRLDSDGAYGSEGYVYQALAPLPRFGEDYTLVGSWVINGEPAGIGLREDASPITRNTSRFVPHYFVAD